MFRLDLVAIETSSLHNWFNSVEKSLMSHEQEKNSGPCQAWKVAEPILGHVKI